MVAVFFSLSGYRYLGDGDTDRREILHDGTHRSRTLSPFTGGTPRDPWRVFLNHSVVLVALALLLKGREGCGRME